MALTDLDCRNAKPQEKTYKLFDGKGLYLEVSPIGSKYWRYKYRFVNKEKKLSIGVYPEISLKEARLKHEEARRKQRDGIPPPSATL